MSADDTYGTASRVAALALQIRDAEESAARRRETLLARVGQLFVNSVRCSDQVSAERCKNVGWWMAAEVAKQISEDNQRLMSLRSAEHREIGEGMNLSADDMRYWDDADMVGRRMATDPSIVDRMFAMFAAEMRSMGQ